MYLQKNDDNNNKGIDHSWSAKFLHCYTGINITLKKKFIINFVFRMFWFCFIAYM